MKYNNAVQINSPGRRAAAYWFADGLPEMLFGLFFLVPSVLILAFEELHWQNWWVSSVIAAMGLLGYLMWFLHRRVLNFFKARITYPRTGYAQPPHDFPDKSHPDYKILTLATANPADENVSSFTSRTIPYICGGVFFMQLFMQLNETRWGLPLAMTGLAATIYFVNRDEARPYSWRAVLPLALAGFIAAPFDLELMSRTFMPMAICGAWLLGIGIWTLVRYLRANPKPDAGQEGRP